MRAACQSGNSTLSLSETLVGNARARPVHTRCTRCTACNARATHVHVRFRQAAGEPGERERGLRVARICIAVAAIRARWGLSTPRVMRFQGKLVDIVLRNAMSLRRVSGCRPQFHAIAGQTDRLFSCCLQIGGTLRRAANHEGHLTSNLRIRPVCEFPQGPPTNLLVRLRELTAYRSKTIGAESLRHG